MLLKVVIMQTMCIRDMFASFYTLNKNGKCEFLANCDEEVVVKWSYEGLTYTLKTTFIEMTINSMALQRSKHQAKLVMKIRTNLRKLKRRLNL